MKFLSRSEELFLLAIWKLKENAYAVTIREQLKEISGKTWAFGAIFITLERLVKKGYLNSYLTEPIPERGGRSKRIYTLTEDGKKVLVETFEFQKNIWDGVEGLAPEKGI